MGRVDQVNPVEPFQRDDRSPDAAVPDQEIVAAADDEPGDLSSIQPSDQFQQVSLILRDGEEVRRPPDLQRGVPGQRFLFCKAAAEGEG